MQNGTQGARGKGKIRITCRKCGQVLQKRPEHIDKALMEAAYSLTIS
jgi:hypothetical protein